MFPKALLNCDKLSAEFFQVFSNDIFVGRYPNLLVTGPGGALNIVGDESLTITNSCRVTIILNAPFDRIRGFTIDNNWLFYVWYTYVIPDRVGKCVKCYIEW